MVALVHAARAAAQPAATPRVDGGVEAGRAEAAAARHGDDPRLATPLGCSLVRR